MPFINVHHLWSWLNPLPKMVSYFWRLFWIFAPSHKYLHLGNLNPINNLKCPNNLEGIFRLLRIFSNVPLNIFRVFLNGIVFLLFQNTEQKQIKRKIENREERECRCQNRRISGRGSRTVRIGRMVTGDKGHEVLPRFGPS